MESSGEALLECVGFGNGLVLDEESTAAVWDGRESGELVEVEAEESVCASEPDRACGTAGKGSGLGRGLTE